MSEWLQMGAGAILVIVVLLDVFSTVIVPRPTHRSARLAPLLGRLIAPAWQAAAGRIRSPRLRQDVRGTLAPVLLVMALGTWLLGLSLGFGLILHAQPENVRAESTSMAESVFQAAMALSTLGVVGADVDGSARAVVAIAGLAGFAVLTLVITFLISIQSALHRREQHVLQLETRAGRPPSATRLLTALGRDDAVLGDFFDGWEGWTADVMQSHLAYPILCRFRSLDEDGEWLTCLGTVLDAAALTIARCGPESGGAARPAGFLLATAERALHELARLLGATPDEERNWAPRWSAHPHLVDALGERDARREEDFVALRRRYAPHVCALAGRLDVIWHDPLERRDGGC